jgi:hypothetical protein
MSSLTNGRWSAPADCHPAMRTLATGAPEAPARGKGDERRRGGIGRDGGRLAQLNGRVPALADGEVPDARGRGVSSLVARVWALKARRN